MSRLSRRGVSLLSVAAVVLLVPLTARLLWVALKPTAPLGPPTESATKTALIRAGLDALALAAAGLSASQATTVVDTFQVAMAAEPNRLSNADSSYASARSSADALERKIQSGLAASQEISSYPGAKTTLAAAEVERADTLDDWFVSATASLDATKKTTLQKVRGNGSWQVPMEFLVLDRSQQEWVDVRQALSNERICAKHGDPPNVSQQASLATWRSATAVAAAKVSYTANLAAVQSAWDAAAAQ